MIETFLGEKPLQFVGLPLIAGFVCIWSWYMAIAMIEQARNLQENRRAVWTVNSALVAGNGIWATHYISMIAYTSDGRAWYEVGDVLTSAALIYVCAAVACYFLVYRDSVASRLIAGFSLGAGIAAMPFVGILSVVDPSRAGWNEMIVFAAAASSVALTIGAVASMQRGPQRQSRVLSLTLLVSAVGLAHFFALSSGLPTLDEPKSTGAMFGTLAYVSKLIGFFGALVFAGIGAGIFLDRFQESREQYALALEGMVAKLQISEQQALAANRAKSAFLANINHEIRTPLNSVLGMLDVLQASELNPEQKLQVKIARESAENLHQTLKDILSLTIIDSGNLALEDKPYDIRALIGDVANQMTPKSSAKGLILSTHVKPDMPPLLSGDCERVRQVVAHLVSNAVKFTDRGSIEISAACGEVADGFAKISISVKDTGIGIDPAVLPSLFERFSQADVSLARKAGGTGVGLSICQKIAHLVGGGIEVESAPGSGSVFRFWFPSAVITRAIATENDHSPKRRLKILVVDDNHSNLYFMSTLLGAEGHVCDFATDGFEAIRCATKERYDIILMDVQMPEMDGLTATAKIRGMEPAGVRVPILAVSAGEEAADRERCAAADMDGYVAKPVRPALLNQAIAAALASSSMPSKPVVDVSAAANCEAGIEPDAQAPLLDQGVVNSLFELFGDDEFQEAIGRTLDEATDLAIKIRLSIAQRDEASTRKFAHGLKGMAASWGALRIAETARRLENENERDGGLPALADELDRLIVETRAELDSASWTKGQPKQRAIA